MLYSWKASRYSVRVDSNATVIYLRKVSTLLLYTQAWPLYSYVQFWLSFSQYIEYADDRIIPYTWSVYAGGLTVENCCSIAHL